MDTLEFLNAVLPEEGMYCVFAFRKQDKKRVQKFYKTLNLVAGAANEFNKNGFDLDYEDEVFFGGYKFLLFKKEER